MQSLLPPFAAATLALMAVLTIQPEAVEAQFQDDVIVENAADLQPQQPQNFWVQADAFDQWLYGAYGTVHDVQTRLNAQLEVQIEDIQRVCEQHGTPLTEIQKKKLRLAARGDIQRFEERVEKVRSKFEEVRTDQNRINEIFQDIQPLQLKLQAGLFGANSLFEKTTSRILTAGQQNPRNKLLDERRRIRYRAQIGVALATLENGLPLLAEQREKLTELLVAETEPPKSFTQQDYYYVLLQMSKVPEDKMRVILDEMQWKMLQPYLDQGRGMEHFLRQQEQQVDGEAAPAAVPGGLF